jgi:hypothetical protein
MTDVFIAEFQHEFIECTSIDDAVALMTADTYLQSDSAQDCTPQELDQLIDVLVRYGQDDSAAAFRRMSSQIRAAGFLKANWG